MSGRRGSGREAQAHPAERSRRALDFGARVFPHDVRAPASIFHGPLFSGRTSADCDRRGLSPAETRVSVCSRRQVAADVGRRYIWVDFHARTAMIECDTPSSPPPF